MRVHSKLSGASVAMLSVSESKELTSHRWMVKVLAEMIEYSEAYELHDVADSLIAAIESISPTLMYPKVAHAPTLYDAEPLPKKNLANVVEFNIFTRRSGGCSDGVKGSDTERGSILQASRKPSPITVPARHAPTGSA